MTTYAPPGGPLLPPNRRVRRSRPPAEVLTAPEEPRPTRRPDESLPQIAPRDPAAGSLLSERLRAAVGVLVTVAATLACVWGIVRYTRTSPRFAIRTVNVDGATHRSPADIARIGGITVGANIFMADLQAIRFNLVNDPWIEQATVSWRLPSTVVVNVVEREPSALVAIGADLYLSTRRGELFKKLAPGDPYDFPIVTGILPDDVVKDRAGVVAQTKRALDLVAEYEHAGPQKALPVQEVHMDDDGGLTLVVGKEPLALHMGKGPYRQGVEQAARVIAEVRERHAQAQVIFSTTKPTPSGWW